MQLNAFFLSIMTSFVAAVLNASKAVIIDAKSLIDLVKSTQQPDDDVEEKIVGVARALASGTHALIATINEHIKQPTAPTLAEEYVLSAAKDVRSGVLEFVQAVRSAASNPFDFLSQQTVDNRFK